MGSCTSKSSVFVATSTSSSIIRERRPRDESRLLPPILRSTPWEGDERLFIVWEINQILEDSARTPSVQ